MSAFYNLAKMTVSSGTTGTLTLGAAVSSFLTFADAGAVDGETISYLIIDGANREVGRATYNSTGPTISGRTVIRSTNAGSPISATTNAVVGIAPVAEDLRPFSTGDLKATLKTTADTDWVMMNDGHIGDASSGSGTRANADTKALFVLLYAFADADVPLFTSSGVGTTRGAQGSAATAFAAHCRMSLPKSLGRALAISGAGSGLTSRTIASVAGAETETPTLSKTASHFHPLLNDANAGVGVNQFSYAGSDNGQSTGAVGGGTPLSIVDPRVHFNLMVKL